MHSKITSVPPYTLGGGLVTQSYPALVTPQTVACQAPLSIGFSRQEYWSALPFPSPRGLPDSGIEPGSPALQVDSLPTEPLSPVHIHKKYIQKDTIANVNDQ